MLKKLLFYFSVFSVLSSNYGHARLSSFEEYKGTGNTKTARATWKGTRGQQIIIESADSGSCSEYIQTLRDLPRKDGYPDVEGKSFNLLNLDRQKVGNPYHLYKVLYQEPPLRRAKTINSPTLLGFVQFGRMPTLGYPEGVAGNPKAHHPIIQKFLRLGVTRQKNRKRGLAKENVERIGNRGLAVILPIFKRQARRDQQQEMLRVSYDLLCRLTMGGRLLPVEGTSPHAVVALHHPADPIKNVFRSNGFIADSNPSFGWFYPKQNVPQPRIMYTKLLPLFRKASLPPRRIVAQPRIIPIRQASVARKRALPIRYQQVVKRRR